MDGYISGFSLILQMITQCIHALSPPGSAAVQNGFPAVLSLWPMVLKSVQYPFKPALGGVKSTRSAFYGCSGYLLVSFTALNKLRCAETNQMDRA